MKIISSDNTLSFTSRSLRRKLNFYGVALSTIRYNPRAHGIVENSNRNIQMIIRILRNQLNLNWVTAPPMATLMLNVNPRQDLDYKSSFELLFGKNFVWQEQGPISNEEVIDEQDYLKKIRTIRKKSLEAVKKAEDQSGATDSREQQDQGGPVGPSTQTATSQGLPTINETEDGTGPTAVPNPRATINQDTFQRIRDRMRRGLHPNPKPKKIFDL